jgi:hypothetical protein
MAAGEIQPAQDCGSTNTQVTGELKMASQNHHLGVRRKRSSLLWFRLKEPAHNSYLTRARGVVMVNINS